MASSKHITCPLCGWGAFERKDSKRSDRVHSARIQMHEHLLKYHMDEVRRRMGESDDNHLR